MCLRNLGFVFLVWFPGVLQAQDEAQPCIAPNVIGGYLVPKQEAYSHEADLTYGCDDGLKPVVEGWWATSTCQNGTWSPEPQCIDEKACMPPDIPNAKYTQNAWYKDGLKIRITCDNGYEPKDHSHITATCVNGTWSSVPVCEKRVDACSEPPKIPHAVIIHQEYEEVFPDGTTLQYECEKGYTVEGVDTKSTIICIFGSWTESLTCSSRPGTGQGGSTMGGAGGGDTTSVASGKQPQGGDTRPDTGHDGSTVGREGGGQTTTTGSGTQPAGGGSSTTSASNERDSRPLVTSVNHCGAHPKVSHGDVVQKNQMYLKYQCSAFYKLTGPDTVVCYSDGSWSELPICKEAFCVIDPAQYRVNGVQLSGVEYIKEGENKYIPCIWHNTSSHVKCTNGILHYTQCCWNSDLQRGACWYYTA
ncbi:complement factor H-like isoform X2 [Plectropomus leopardus]|uniref:complement factor H-like isoform X2 n=1 Tax=Plectropomus leopardus TaxID=160734 RepID=UPI001C4CB1E2|nr:complement factor H-like isoform X2 [Plectropomus leopardus]